jgi:NAD(P)-dependent dehydrogenase (short-subunit alcohol dehydrogenase family)
MNCLRAEVAYVGKDGRGGSIVNMSSVVGLSGQPMSSSCMLELIFCLLTLSSDGRPLRLGTDTAAKHGVIGLTKTAAKDYGPKVT